MTIPAGPYAEHVLEDGTRVPKYIIPFDKDGECTGPKTRQHLIDTVRKGSFTHLYLYSHGWNNVWEVATKRYDDFLKGYVDMRAQYGLQLPKPYRPILVGIFWPSAALAFGEDERGPGFAAAAGRTPAEEEAIEDIVAALPDGARQRGRELLMKQRLEKAEALEVARMTRPLFAVPDDETGGAAIGSPEEIVALWRSETASHPYDRPAGTLTGPSASDPAAAGGLDWLDPRPLLRTFTVYRMKDRAGRVGAKGVQPLLRELLVGTSPRVHLIGHSYGGKVVLSSVGYGDDLPRKVESVLLLQPAVSHLCFAERLPKSNEPGGYRPVLDRVVQPVLATFSDRDVPLHDTFHIAMRREADLGDARIAGNEPPSRYAALGGYGPRGAGEKLIPMQEPIVPYAFEKGVRLIGLDGSKIISSHGDISNRGTWWALYNQVQA